MIPPSPVAGADGCRSGWVVATLRPGDDPDGPAGPPPTVVVDAPRGRLGLVVAPAIAPVVAAVAAGHLAALAVDMPVGLPATGPRACDVEARRRLGPRRSSVFPAPVRATLGAATHAEALARSRATAGVGLSIQAFNLLPAIAELDEAITPALQDRVAESHPELAFARLAGAPLPHPKRTAPGRDLRLALLAAAGLGDLAGVRLPGAAADDVLDAAVLTLAAERIRTGTVERLGDGTVDATGLRMEVAL